MRADFGARAEHVAAARRRSAVRRPNLSTLAFSCTSPWIVVAIAACGGGSDATDVAGGPGDTGTGASTGTGAIDPSAASTGAASSDDGDAPGSSSGALDEPDLGVPEAPGVWHVESPADSARTWLVSPEGERVFWLGVNTVMRDKTCDGIVEHWVRRTDPSTAANVEWARLSNGRSGGESNASPYCFNSVGGFSDTNDFDGQGGDSWMIRSTADGGAGAPFGQVLTVDARSDDWALADEDGTVLRGGFAEARIGDPFNPAFLDDLEQRVAQDVAPRVGNPRLQMWFLGNETGMFDHPGHGASGVHDMRRWIWSPCPDGSSIDAPTCAPHALLAFLRERYGTIDALDAAWDAGYADFEAIATGPDRPVPYAHDCNLTCREDLQRFTHDVLLRRWIAVTTETIRATDPDHLITTPRLALGNASSHRFWAPASSADPDHWAEAPDVPVPTDGDVVYCPYDLFARDGDAGFDLIAVNVYDGSATFSEPWLGDGFAKLHERSGLPIIVSEFSVRARIDGWSNLGGSNAFVSNTDGVDDQIQRGAYYGQQIDQFASHPYVLGASWHAWSDRYTAADPSHQINMGLVQCDDPARGFEAGQRWGEIDERIAEANCAIADRIAALTGL